jgi:hypothetical protein
MKENDVKRALKDNCPWVYVESIENALSAGMPDTVALYDDMSVFLEIKIARNSGDVPKIQLRSSQIMFFRRAHDVKFNGAFIVVVHKEQLLLFNGVVKQDQIGLVKNGNGCFSVELNQTPLFNQAYNPGSIKELMMRLLPRGS